MRTLFIVLLTLAAAGCERVVSEPENVADASVDNGESDAEDGDAGDPYTDGGTHTIIDGQHLWAPSASPSSSHLTRWTLTFQDEFNGPLAGEDPSCYTRVPQCMFNLGWGHRDCAPEAEAQLADLNKCVWSVYNGYNYMDQSAPLDSRINAFDGSMVSVRDGALELRAQAQPVADKDCGRPFSDPSMGDLENRTRDCPIISGAVMSQRFKAWDESEFMRGFAQGYGRFEVRAKLPAGPGSWPAHWMLPQDATPTWPYSGEIDIMENWWSSKNEVKGSLHWGDYPSLNGFNKGFKRLSTDFPYTHADTWFDDFHTYAVEWDPWEIRFYVDRWQTGSIRDGEMIRHSGAKKDFPFGMPDRPFYWILNSTVAPFLDSPKSARPDPENFTPQLHLIDYVRAYRTCESPSDRCPNGGTYDGTHCYVTDVPANVHAWVEGKSFAYVSNSPAECHLGGARNPEGVCVASYEFEPFLRDSKLYLPNACVENTISPTCRNPCEGVGLHANEGCFIGDSPDQMMGEVKNGKFYYFTVEYLGEKTAEDCLPGDAFEPEEGCVFGKVPAGRSGLVSNNGKVAGFYVNHLCAPHAGVANCANPCPKEGAFDGVGCFLRTAPTGTSAIVHDNAFYYQRLSANEAEACPAGGELDGANCRLGAAPAGTTAFLKADRFYVNATCGNVPY